MDAYTAARQYERLLDEPPFDPLDSLRELAQERNSKLTTAFGLYMGILQRVLVDEANTYTFTFPADGSPAYLPLSNG